MHNFRVYWISLYMFRTVFPSTIRSSRLYIQHQVYVIQVSWQLANGHVPASKQSTNLYDIYLILCVQSWTPDDGRKDRPKHVEWYSINSKIVHLVGFTIEIISWHFIASLGSCFFDAGSDNREVMLVLKTHELKLHHNLQRSVSAAKV